MKRLWLLFLVLLLPSMLPAQNPGYNGLDYSQGSYNGRNYGPLFPTLNVDAIYTGNSSTVGTTLTGAIGDASMASNNCVPTTCAQWGTPGGSGANFFVGANQGPCNNLGPVALNGGGPTYSAGALNYNNIEYTNTSTLEYWSFNLATISSSTANLTFGVCVANLPAVGSATIDMFFLQDSYGSKAWSQAHKCANGDYGWTIESSVLTSGGSAEPCIDSGSSTAFPSAFLVSENYNESTAGLGAYGTYSSGASISITSFTGTSGTLTFSATNTLAPGNSVYLTGFTSPNTGLNGQTVIVLSAGLSSSAFEATVTGSGYSSGAGTGDTVIGTTGQTCSVSATGSVYGYTTLQGTNSLTGATVYLVATPGTPFGSAPTSATLSSGASNANPAACSGTITMTGATLGGVATISIHNATTGALIGQQQVAVAYHASPSLSGLDIGQGENYTGAASFYYQNLLWVWTGTVPTDIYSAW
jgi:hypothetical protein